MTPLEMVRLAELFFATGTLYHFDVPDGHSMSNYTQSIREHALKLSYHWRVVYWGAGRRWLIKQK